MKKLYLIQSKIYDTDFDTRIKAIGSWVKYFDNNWIVETTLTSHEIYNKISFGFENESMLIVELSKTNYWGRMNTKVWDYLKEKKK